MKLLIKNNPIKLIIISLILGYITLVITYLPHSCTTQKPKHAPFATENLRRLSDNEKIKIAVAEVLNNYPKKNPKGSYSLPKNEFKYDGNIPPKEPVAYRDIDEFFAVNPNCCQITQRYKIVSQSAEINGSIDKISFWDQLNGTTTIVVVQYLLRYRDALGVVQSRLKETYSVMDDCGESRGVFYEREPLGIILISPIFDFLF